jgi:hypothetical protein
MPNNEGREMTRGEKAAETRRRNAAAKASTSTSADGAGPAEVVDKAVAGDTAGPRRKTPLERAEESLAKATAELEKIKARRAKLKESYDELAQEERDAQDEVDYAAVHPALVRKRREEGGNGIAVAPGYSVGEVAAEIVATIEQRGGHVPAGGQLPAYPDPSTFPPASSSAEVSTEPDVPVFADGSEIISSVPLGEGEDDVTDEDEGVLEDVSPLDAASVGDGVAPAEPFEYPAGEPAEVPTFDFAAALAQSQPSEGPQTFRV